MTKNIILEKLNLPYFYGKEFENFIFFKLPKCLFTQKRLITLSSDCKILYSLMLDRVVLSEKSNWRDEDGKIYIIYTNEEATKMLGKSTKTVTTIMTKLENEGLIERKKQGLGKPDLIFVKNLLALSEEESDVLNLTVNSRETVKNISFVPEKTVQPVVNEVEKLYTFEEIQAVDNLDSEKKLPLQSGNNDVSRVVKVTSLDQSELPPTKTDKTNTKNIKNEVLRPILPPNPNPTYPQSPDEEQGVEEWRGFSKTQKEFFVRCDLDSAFGDGEDGLYCLFSSYRKNKSKMKILVDMLLGMSEREETANHFEDYSPVKFNFKITKLYSNALVEMLTAKEMIKIKTGYISYSELYEKLIPHISYDEDSFEIRLDNIAHCTVLAYGDANKQTEIKFPAHYMKSCIWTVLSEGAIRDEANFQYRYG